MLEWTHQRFKFSVTLIRLAFFLWGCFCYCVTTTSLYLFDHYREKTKTNKKLRVFVCLKVPDHITLATIDHIEHIVRAWACACLPALHQVCESPHVHLFSHIRFCLSLKFVCVLIQNNFFHLKHFYTQNSGVVSLYSESKSKDRNGNFPHQPMGLWWPDFGKEIALPLSNYYW